MVSFQCHACGDVVKKPKLDQHRGRCQSGFDCIDCHATFHNPGEYKGHTSCMTEAEKHEKTLYKGPKTTNAPPRNNYHPNGSAPIDNRGYPTYSQRGRGGWTRGNGRGGMPQQRVQNGWGRPRYEGTGANDTPLGTPKMSPVTRSPAPEDPPAPAAAVAELPAPSAVPVVEKKIKDKSKKRKSAPVDEQAVSALNEPQEPVIERPPKKVKVVSEPVDAPKKRKEKKSKRSAEEKDKKSETKITKTEEMEAEPKRKSKKRKSVALDEVEQKEASKGRVEKAKKEKYRDQHATSVAAETKGPDEAKVMDKKEKKKRKSLSEAAQGDVKGDAPEEKRKKKKTLEAESQGEKVKKRSKAEKIDGGD